MKEIDLIVVLERNIDSFAAGEIVHKNIKHSKTVLYRKSTSYYTFVSNIIKEHKDCKINFYNIGFCPSLYAVQTLKEDLSEYVSQLNVYINEEVTGVITEYLDIIKVFPSDMSITSYLNLESKQTVTPVVNLLDILSLDKNNIGKLVLKLTPFSYYATFITDRTTESIDKISYTSKVLTNQINIQSKVNVENITFHVLDGISIPFINTIHHTKHKVLENLMKIMDNEYSIVGTYQIINRDEVAISFLFNGKGNINAKQLAEKYGGSGSVFKSGCYYPLDKFF